MHIRHTALSFRPGLPNRRNRSGQKPVRPHPKPAAGQALLDSIADLLPAPQPFFANFLAFRSKAHYNITYYYNLYTEQDQEDL